MLPTAEDVLEFWFAPGLPIQQTYRRWFTKDPEFDQELRSRFGELHAEAAADTLRGWSGSGSARGELALIVVLDQFSRNLFRESPRAFETDAHALRLARDLRITARARELSLIQRMVALLPFEHTEDRATQAESVAAFQQLYLEAVANNTPEATMLAGALDYALKHQAIIERFGRFPHRNKVLGRVSTDEEIAFLREPGSSF